MNHSYQTNTHLIVKKGIFVRFELYKAIIRRLKTIEIYDELMHSFLSTLLSLSLLFTFRVSVTNKRPFNKIISNCNYSNICPIRRRKSHTYTLIIYIYLCTTSSFHVVLECVYCEFLLWLRLIFISFLFFLLYLLIYALNVHFIQPRTEYIF